MVSKKCPNWCLKRHYHLNSKPNFGHFLVILVTQSEDFGILSLNFLEYLNTRAKLEGIFILERNLDGSYIQLLTLNCLDFG